MNIVLLGEEAAGLQMFRLLARSGHRIVAVMTSPPGDGAGFSNLWNAAEKHGAPVWPAALVKDAGLPATLREAQVDILLNIHSLVIVPAAVLEAPRYGCFNLHPGPLPRYSGLNSVSWAIYHGERHYGVTLHQMVPGIDMGPIAAQALFDIAETDTALSVFMRCVKEGLPLVSQLLHAAAEGPDRLALTPQDLAKREYFGREVPHGGRLSWSLPAAQVVDFVRACDYLPFVSPWGHPQTALNGRRIDILKASRTGEACDVPPGSVGDPRGTDVPVAAADEWVLVHEVQVDGGNPRPADVLPPGSRLGT